MDEVSRRGLLQASGLGLAGVCLPFMRPKRLMKVIDYQTKTFDEEPRDALGFICYRSLRSKTHKDEHLHSAWLNSDKTLTVYFYDTDLMLYNGIKVNRHKNSEPILIEETIKADQWVINQFKGGICPTIRFPIAQYTADDFMKLSKT